MSLRERALNLAKQREQQAQQKEEQRQQAREERVIQVERELRQSLATILSGETLAEITLFFCRHPDPDQVELSSLYFEERGLHWHFRREVYKQGLETGCIDRKRWFIFTTYAHSGDKADYSKRGILVGDLEHTLLILMGEHYQLRKS